MAISSLLKHLEFQDTFDTVVLDGEIWYRLIQISEFLGYTKNRGYNVVSKENQKTILRPTRVRGNFFNKNIMDRKVLFINEAGILEMIMRSQQWSVMHVRHKLIEYALLNVVKFGFMMLKYNKLEK
jgi:prophage antirepressor-like protein